MHGMFPSILPFANVQHWLEFGIMSPVYSRLLKSGLQRLHLHAILNHVQGVFQACAMQCVLSENVSTAGLVPGSKLRSLPLNIES
jgi:hypothetical protein